MAKKAAKARMQTLKTGRCRSGFTLLELITVIFIISLLLAIVFPSFYGFGEKNLKTDARRIASVLRYLNDTAIATKETYFLKFDFDRDTLSWKDSDGERKEGFKTLSSVELQSKGEVKEGQIMILFSSLGIQENITVHLRDKDEEMAVTFNPISGRAKIMQSAK
ncbi:MAG: prepilin-type N-terminal cleavage/methylation domain-containing protein [Nitrospira sp.]|nr:prepilin-type N-terminal cleavage/methylation domain-containing protein [Nitrospira sp.]